MQQYQQMLQKIKEKQRKRVRFNNKVYVQEIPYVKDIFTETIIKELYYTAEDYEKFKRNYIFELYCQEL